MEYKQHKAVFSHDKRRPTDKCLQQGAYNEFMIIITFEHVLVAG